MNKLLMMVQILGSFFCNKCLRSMLACRLMVKRGLGLTIERERARLSSFAPLWRHSIELDGIYRLHIDLAYDGAFELFWRHHSGRETPSEVFPSLRQVVIAALRQIEHYLKFSRSCEWTAA
jgi:hypothetical protein